MATRQKPVTVWEDDLIELIRAALARPNDYAEKSQVFGTKLLMVRIGRPAAKEHIRDGTLQITITKKEAISGDSK